MLSFVSEPDYSGDLIHCPIPVMFYETFISKKDCSVISFDFIALYAVVIRMSCQLDCSLYRPSFCVHILYNDTVLRSEFVFGCSSFLLSDSNLLVTSLLDESVVVKLPDDAVRQF